jgi:hypothetical protein
LGALKLHVYKDGELYEALSSSPAPTSITYRKEDRFFRVISRSWEPIRSL